MAKSKASEALDDLFGVDPDGGNIINEESHDSFYGEAADASEEASFEDKADIVKGKIDAPDEKEEVEFGGVPEKQEEVEEPSDDAQELSDERAEPSQDFESILADAVPASPSEPEGTQKVDSKEASLVEEDEPQDKKEDSVEVQPTPPSNNEKEEIGDLEDHGWQVACPSPMWEEFYERKREAIRQHVLGREINFGKMYGELKKAKVDIRVSLSDHEGIHTRMQELQGWRDRVVQMRAEVNSQYFLWKRLVPLFEGLVAMVQYEKPAARQEGVIHSRMNDMITYLSKIESMYETTKDIIGNLDAAYDSLSRQVTMSMPRPTAERYGSPPADEKVPDPKLSDYDSLDEGGKSGVKRSSSSSSESKKSKKSADGKPEEIMW